MSVITQSYFIPKPTLTEENCPDQTGRVHVITGGYGGVGLELAKILYQHNATLYLAGRSADKASSAIAQLKESYPSSKGSLSSIIVDFSDLTTIKPSLQTFLSEQKALHGLTLNAGVMHTPAGSKSAQGYDLQLATNCLGSFLFYKLLRPALVSGSRVTWASSLTMDLQSPKPGGVVFTSDGTPDQTLNPQVQYAQTKAGNSHIAAVLARRDASAGITHLSFNPGNLKTDLARHMAPLMRTVVNAVFLHPAKFGGYTELWALLADVPVEKSGGYVAPWGRIELPNRKDLKVALEDKSETSVGERFVSWLEKETKAYA